MLTSYQAISGSRPAVVEPSQPTPDPLLEAPAVAEIGDILIPGPVSTLINLTYVHELTEPTEQPMPCLQQARMALRNSVRQEDQKPVHVVCLLLDKEDQVHLGDSGIPAPTHSSSLYHPEGEVQDTFQGSLQSSPTSQLKAQTCSQSRGPSGTPGVTAVTTPKTQTRGRSKTITSVKPPAPAPARKSPECSFMTI